MSARLAGAVARMERRRGLGAAPCPECGGVPRRGGSFQPEQRIGLVFPGGEGDAGGPATCPACGRVLVVELSFDRPDAEQRGLRSPPNS